MTVPTPSQVAPWYLRNINQALALDETTGEVYVRTGITGDVYITGPVTIPGSVAVTQDTTPWVISGNVNATITGTPQVALSSTVTDAFGRLRVSNPFTLFDTQARYYDHGQFSTTLAGSGAVVYNANASTFSLNVSNASGDSVIRETKKVFPYQPGKSLLIFSTFSMAALKANLRQRVGFFGAQNGIFFEVDGLTINLVIRSYTGGVVTEDRVPQANWNGDRLNGLGGASNPSGITLNPQYDQIFWADVEWLGVGSVRCGFVINGTFYTCHTFNHANLAGNTTTYMTTATLPVRYEITNTAITSGSSTLTQICASVISEGGYNQSSITESAGTGILGDITLTTKGIYYPIVSIRLASTRLDAIVVPSQVDLLGLGENYYRWVLLKNATLTGATWAGTSATGTVEYDTAATNVTGGTEVQSGFAFSKSINQLVDGNIFSDQLGRTLAGVSDTLTLAVSAASNSAKIYGQLGWQELT
jgi:hypothetical protein